MNRKPRRVLEDDISEGSTEYHTKFAAPYSSSEGEVTRLELERQLSVSLAVQTERDHCIAQLTDKLALKSAAQATAAEAAKRAGLRCVRFVVVYPLQDIVLTLIRGQSCGRSWCWS